LENLADPEGERGFGIIIWQSGLRRPFKYRSHWRASGNS
jgi:hypothetical protein